MESENPIPVATTTDGGATFGAAGRTVPARLFELGEYPDKRFSLDEREADEAIAAFEPVPILINHRMSDGNKPDLFGIGRVESVARSGNQIVGAITFSDWAAQMLRGAERKLSVGWNVAKRIVEVSLVLDPRVESAELLHAFQLDGGSGAAPEARKGAPMSIIATLKEKLGISDAQVSEMRREFSASSEIEDLRTQLGALKAENATLREAVDRTGKAASSRFAKTRAAEVARSFVGRKIVPADESLVAAAFEAAFAGSDPDGEEPPVAAALRRDIEARPDLAATETAFGAIESPTGRKPETAVREPFDAVARFNAAPGEK